jgi:hypothetical protein
MACAEVGDPTICLETCASPLLRDTNIVTIVALQLPERPLVFNTVRLTPPLGSHVSSRRAEHGGSCEMGWQQRGQLCEKASV